MRTYAHIVLRQIVRNCFLIDPQIRNQKSLISSSIKK